MRHSSYAIDCFVSELRHVAVVVVSDDPPVCNLSMYFSCAVPTISESHLNAFNYTNPLMHKVAKIVGLT